MPVEGIQPGLHAVAVQCRDRFLAFAERRRHAEQATRLEKVSTELERSAEVFARTVSVLGQFDKLESPTRELSAKSARSLADIAKRAKSHGKKPEPECRDGAQGFQEFVRLELTKLQDELRQGWSLAVARICEGPLERTISAMELDPSSPVASGRRALFEHRKSLDAVDIFNQPGLVGLLAKARELAEELDRRAAEVGLDRLSELIGTLKVGGLTLDRISDEEIVELRARGLAPRISLQLSSAGPSAAPRKRSWNSR